MKKLLAVAVSLAALWTAGDAHAILISIGDPIATQSWDQSFRHSGAGKIDKLEIFMESSGSFADESFREFSDSSWRSTRIAPDYAKAEGRDSEDLGFNIHFEGYFSDRFSFSFIAWDDDAVREHVTAIWDGRWDFSDCTKDIKDYDRHDKDRHDHDHHDKDCPPTTVPEPSALILLGGGLVGLALVRKNRKPQA